MLRVITFDVTNTLLRVKHSPVYWYIHEAKRNGVYSVREDLLITSYRTEWSRMRREFPAYGQSAGMTSQDWWRLFVRRVFHSADFKDEEILTKITKALWENFAGTEYWEVEPQSHAVLEQLAQKYNLSVISNFDERLEYLLTKFGHRRYFEHIFTPISTGLEKPHPGIFTQAWQTHKVEPKCCLHVGDNVRNDYVTPVTLGSRALLVRNSQAPEDLKDIPCDDVIPRLSHVLYKLDLPTR